jgi:acyl-CoA thioesterase-2
MGPLYLRAEAPGCVLCALAVSTPDVLAQLVRLLSLEKLEENLFRGQSQDLGWGTVFGGQVLGQALSAAVQTVPLERQAHSLQAHFLRPGDVSRPIVYQVDRIRDGSSFTTRRVVAVQGGQPMLHLSASFQIDEPGFTHQTEMPQVPPPESVPNEAQTFSAALAKSPKVLQRWSLAARPFDNRPVDESEELLAPPVRPPRRMLWLKTVAPLPDDPALHRSLLAYASDAWFLTTSLLPHGVTWLTPGMQVASLDHAMWFHAPFRADEWLLHVIDSPAASGARGLVRGSVFKRDGTLVASTAQEGLIRQRAPRPADSSP